VSVNFVLVTEARVSETLVWIERLYRHEGIVFDEKRAQRAVEGLIGRPEYGGVWLLETVGTVGGYFALTVGYSLEFGGHTGLLDELFIAEEWRGKGFGGAALQFATDWCRARGFEAVRLEVDPRNLTGQRLYRRAGFELQERYLMTRWITDRTPVGISE
jgi:GNAT superfamily N-acetyltransferase